MPEPDDMIELMARAMCDRWCYAPIGTPDGDAEWRRKQRMYRALAEASITALTGAGYIIVPATSQLLEKGGESGVKLVDPGFGAPTGFRSE